MIALYNFIPHFCPNCGTEIHFKGPFALSDYTGGASHFCKGCELHYARVSSKALIDASKQETDLAQYVKE